MKSIIIRSLLITAVSLLVFQELNAQRGRGRNNRNYRNYGYGYGYGNRYPRTQVYLGFSSPRFYGGYGGYYPGYYHYPRYFRPYPGYIRPRIGIHVNILPRGYSSFYLGSNPYYYYGGSYYRPGSRANDYEVVDAPLGASVPELPDGAQVVVINDQKYYERDGTYYKEDIRDNSEIWYTVVGKNGKIDTDEAPLPPQNSGPAVGDIVDKLPENTRTVTLNGHKYYVTPDDIYYEETIQQNTIRYKIVGM